MSILSEKTKIITGTLKINDKVIDVNISLPFTETTEIDVDGLIIKFYTDKKQINNTCIDCGTTLSNNSHYNRHIRNCKTKNKKIQLNKLNNKMSEENTIKKINPVVSSSTQTETDSKNEPLEERTPLESKVAPVELKKKKIIFKKKKKKKEVEEKKEEKKGLDFEFDKINGVQDYWHLVNTISITDRYFLDRCELGIYNGLIFDKEGVVFGKYEDWVDDEIPDELKICDVVSFNGLQLYKYVFDVDKLYEEYGIDYRDEEGGVVYEYRYDRKKEELIYTNLITT